MPVPVYQLKLPLIVDVYELERPVKWTEMNPKPYRAILQCTKGQFHKDIQCRIYIDECNALGIKYGLYHYLFPNNIEEQAAIYKEHVTELGGLGHFPPVVDVEYKPPAHRPDNPDNMPRGGQWADQIKVWLDLTEAWSGQKPVIYTSGFFWKYTHDQQGNPPEWTDEYPLWVAWYPNKLSIDANNVPRANRMPAGWTKHSLWQYSESGRTDGFLANDLNSVTPEFQSLLDQLFP